MGQMDDEFYSGVNDNNSKVNKDPPERNGRIIVRNISFKATKEALKEHFAKFGTVNEVNLLKKPDGKLVGCGFVHFADVAMAETAIAATNKKPFLDRPIHVAFAVPKKNYVQNMQNDRPRFTSTLDEDHKPSVKNRPIHVAFAVPKKNYVQNMQNDRPRFTSTLDEDHKPSVKNEVTGVSEKSKEKKERVNRNARLIIRNVSFKANEETLKEHFEPYGDVLEVKLLKKPDGKLVGCAFVHFKNVPMAKKALLSTNMKPFLGRPISVDWAVAKNKYMQHQVNQQLELEEDVKKEESDSDDDDKKPLNVSSEEVKAEVKDESDADAKESSDSESDDDDDDDEHNSKEDDDSEEGSDSEDEDMAEEDDEQETVNVKKEEGQRIKLNDAEDGCTVFLTNVPFSVDNHQLRQFAERCGPVRYALVCVDRLTEHSKGSGFVKFVSQEHADTFLSLPADQLKLDGQVVQIKPALKRENLQKGSKKEAKDNRNLYLVKEGVVVAGTKAAVGLSASDMAKRLALERSKTQMLKNLNRFVSRYRLVVSNLPAHVDDARLRRICVAAGDKRAAVTECRVMRDLRAPPGSDGKHPSKGYGFVMFTRHEDALACLRKLNNNPDVFDKNNRPIVSFSIEDRTALNARKKRLEKSIANNPLANKDGGAENTNKRNRKRKSKMAPAPDESYAAAKRRKFGKSKFNQNQNTENNEGGGMFVRKPRDDEMGAYTGLTAKQGGQHKMRTNHKLKAQAEIHRQTVKMEKKKSKRSQRFKMAAKERVKQPKQKINKNPNKKRNKKFKPKSKYELLRG